MKIFNKIRDNIGRWFGLNKLFKEMKKNRVAQRMLAIQICGLMEKNCENSGLNWLDKFNEETK